MKCLSNETVITRKPHHCWGCTIEYPANTKMRVEVDVDGGHINRSYWCQTCNDFIKTLDSWDCMDGWEYGGLLNYDNHKLERE